MTHEDGHEYARLAQALHEGRAALRALEVHAAELTGLHEHTLSKVRHMADEITRLQTKFDEVQEKVAGYKSREEKLIADRDAVIEANKGAVDTLNAKIAELQAKIDAGQAVDAAAVQALVDDMQSTVDDLKEAQPNPTPPNPTPNPGETPIP